MAKNLTELCTLLVNDFYGELSSLVFATLARFGRLTFNQLHFHTQLSRRHLKHGLVVLVQQHLALHYTPDGEDTYYEADLENAYALVRTGKLIKVVEDRFGAAAGGIISNLLLLGHANIGDLADAYHVTLKRKGAIRTEEEHVNGAGLPNGVGKHVDTNRFHDHIATLGQLHSTLRQLLDAGFIKQVHRTHFCPSADLDNEAQQQVSRERFPGGVKGMKAKDELRIAVMDRKRKWRDEGDSDDARSSPNGTRPGHDNYQDRARKKRMLNGTNALLADPDDQDGMLLNDNLVVRVNYDKCNVALRNQQLVESAARSLGATTAKVYAALLRRLGDTIPRCHDEFSDFVDKDAELEASVTVTTLETSKVLSASQNLAGLLGSEREDNAVHDVNMKVNGNHDYDWPERSAVEREDSDGETPEASNNDRKGQLTLVEHHIRILADSPHRFVVWAGTRGRGEWRVDFRALTTALIQTTLESIVSARFDGPLPVRIVRVLAAKGKLDEKQVATIGLMRPKDVRAILGAMQEAGFVETQEVPKDTQRQPSRTMYFWFWDIERCRMLVLNDTYKAMARLLQRAKVEREKVRSVIEKAERTDVVGHEDRYLSGMERGALRQWRDIEEKLLCQLSRMDDMVALMRDFIGRAP